LDCGVVQLVGRDQCITGSGKSFRTVIFEPVVGRYSGNSQKEQDDADENPLLPSVWLPERVRRSSDVRCIYRTIHHLQY
jgi:hypothetical protein